MVNKSEFDKQLEKYYSEDNVFGVILVGSSSHYYKDSNSDYDIEIIVNNEYYKQIKNKKLIIRDHETKLEVLFLSYFNFESKINSGLDINHWPYVKGRILYDKNGSISDAIKKISRMGNDLSHRIKLTYFEFIMLNSKIRRILDTGEELNLRLTSSQLAIVASKMFFLIQKQWPPIIYWTAQNFQYLVDEEQAFKYLLLQVFNDPSIINIEKLQNGIEMQLQRFGYDFWCDKETVISDISTDEYICVREKYSFF